MPYEYQEISTPLKADGFRFAIVASRFNSFMVEALVGGAVDTIVRHGGNAKDITVVHVPGSFEIPLACKQLAESGKFDAIVALGVVIRGATDHYEYVCQGAVSGIMSTSLAANVPVGFGLVTVENIDQAIERAGSKAGNKGCDAALAAIEMAALKKILCRKK